MKKMIMIAGGAVLLVGASVGGTLFLSPDKPAVAVYPDGKPMDTAEAALGEPLKRFYYNIHPEFVINLNGKSRAKFLMLEMTAATSDEKAKDAIDDHIPELRNNLLMMLGEQSSTELDSTSGKDALREKALLIVDELVTKHYGPDHVIDVFFTRFVMQ